MNQDLRIYAKGEAFANGVYDLRTLENLISNYRKILDRLVAVHLGKKQIPKDLKNQLDYEVKINSGSIELLIDFVLDHKDYLAVFAADGGETLSKIVVTLLRDAIALRKKASELAEKKLPFTININNSFNIGSKIGNTNVSYDHNSGSILINDPKILFAAQSTRAPVNNILSITDGKIVEYIDMGADRETYTITPDQRDIMGQQKEELPTTLNIIGRLDMVSFSSRKGAIVSDNERFNVTWNDQLRSKIQKIADVEGVIFKVRPVIDHKNLAGDAIGFHIIDCGNPQSTLSI